MSDLAPIVLFVYNRPEHTRRALAALAANPLAIDSDLIIYADGPRKPEHAPSVGQAREVARSASGFKSVRLIERDRNWGLANSIIAGVSEVCAARDRVIVIEDDLLIAPTFLSFMNAGLNRYADENRVLQISGYMFPRIPVGAGALFLPITSTWGWATWDRAWKYFDPSLSGLDIIRKDPKLRRRFDLNGSYDYFWMAEQQRLGVLDSWGIRWYLSAFLREGLTLYPGHSLVRNIGADGSGTHGAGQSELQEEELQCGRSPDVFEMPECIEADLKCLSAVEQLLRSTKPVGVGKWIGWCRRQVSLRMRQARRLGVSRA